GGKIESLKSCYIDDQEPSANLIKAWTKFAGWHLNNFQGSKSYPIKNVIISSDSKSMSIVLDGLYSVDDFSFGVKEWWVSFNELFKTNASLNYIATPIFLMDAELGGTGNASTVYFNGIFVGLPLELSLEEGTVVSLLEEITGLYPIPSGQRLIYVATSATTTNIAYHYDDFTDSEFLLYVKGDDKSKTLRLRKGRVNFREDINEFIVYLGDGESTTATIDGPGAGTQIIDISSIYEENSIVGVNVRRENESLPDPDSDGQYKATIWKVYHGDKLIGYDSTSQREDTILTRANSDAETEPEEIGSYQTSPMFSQKGFVRYPIIINTQTGESIQNPNEIRLEPAANPTDDAKLKDAQVEYISNDSVVKGVTSFMMHEYLDRHMILYTTSQRNFGGISGTSDPAVEATKAVVNIDIDPSESNYLGIDFDQDGLFMISTHDDLELFVSGFFNKTSSSVPGHGLVDDADAEEIRKRIYRIPYMLVPNLTNCSFHFDESDANLLHVVGFAKIGPKKVLSLVYLPVHMGLFFGAETYGVISNSKVAFVHSKIYQDRNVVLRAADITGEIASSVITDGVMSIVSADHNLIIGDKVQVVDLGETVDSQDLKVVSSGDDTFGVAVPSDAVLGGTSGVWSTPSGFEIAGLQESALSVASSRTYDIIVFSHDNGLQYVLGSNNGISWAYFDDIYLVENGTETATSPSIKIYDDSLWICYFRNKNKLYVKKVPWSLILQFHSAFVATTSSSATDSSVIAKKEELQATLDNIEERFIGLSFDHRVSFSINEHGKLLIVYFNEERKVLAAETFNEGTTIEGKPANY
ncbi:MAG: hypothetical protein ACTSWQ_08810, partial [Candidatus Thorarchaeota archaeon]